MWEQLKYRDPKEILIELRKVESSYPLEKLPYNVSTLRTRSLRGHGESRQCALFCYGMSQALNITVGYAESEENDYDFIAHLAEQNAFIPIQMKELVPNKINPNADLQIEVNKLTKYVDSNELCVAMYINKVVSIELNKLELPELNIAELWFFGAANPNQKQWTLVGNVLDQPEVYTFEYPQA